MPRKGTSTGSKRLASDWVCRPIPYLLVQRVSRNEKGEVQITDVQELDDSAKGPASRRSNPTATIPTYRFAAPEDGTYRVLIRDLYAGSRGDPRLAVCLVDSQSGA